MENLERNFDTRVTRGISSSSRTVPRLSIRMQRTNERTNDDFQSATTEYTRTHGVYHGARFRVRSVCVKSTRDRSASGPRLFTRTKSNVLRTSQERRAPDTAFLAALYGTARIRTAPPPAHSIQLLCNNNVPAKVPSILSPLPSTDQHWPTLQRFDGPFCSRVSIDRRERMAPVVIIRQNPSLAELTQRRDCFG